MLWKRFDTKISFEKLREHTKYIFVILKRKSITMQQDVTFVEKDLSKDAGHNICNLSFPMISINLYFLLRKGVYPYDLWMIGKNLVKLCYHKQKNFMT